MDSKNILILTAVAMEARAIPGSTAIGIGGSRLNLIDVPASVTAVLLCGLAGALNPDLAIGDVILDDETNVFPPTVSIQKGKIHTAAAIVTTPTAKAELFRVTGADAVDMEQSVVQAWCDQRHFRLVGLRAISDTASHAVNPAVISFIDDLGRPKPKKLAIGLLKQPSLIPELMLLNSCAKLALQRLGVAIRLLMP